MQYGRCSFKIPHGFEILESGSRPGHDSHKKNIANPVCITLISKYSNIACEPLLSENPKDINIGAFPATLMFNTFASEKKQDPRKYAELKARELGNCLEQFKIVFCNPYKIGNINGIKAQFSFVTNFKMELIQIIWPIKSELAVTSMITCPDEIESKWALLEKFSNSLALV